MDDQTIRALCARVGENFMFIATANKVGLFSTGDIEYSGQSTIIGPKGMSYVPHFYAGPSSADNEEIIIATLDLKNADTISGLAHTFNDITDWGEPTFLPQMWADLWGDADEKLVVTNQELERLKLENKELSQKSSFTTQVNIALGITAAILLITTLTFGVIAFRRKSNRQVN